MVSGSKLRDYRKQRRVSSTEVAVELGKAHTSHVTRLEGRNLSPREFAESVAAIERIVERHGENQVEIDKVFAATLAGTNAA